MFFFGFDCFSTWIMVDCSKDLVFEEFSFSYSFRIDQNLFFIFFWMRKYQKSVYYYCIDRIVIFHMNSCFIHYSNIRSIHIRFFIDYCLWHLIMIKYNVWWSTVPRKRLQLISVKNSVFIQKSRNSYIKFSSKLNIL